MKNNVFGASSDVLRHCHSGDCVEVLDICVFIALFTTFIYRGGVTSLSMASVIGA